MHEQEMTLERKIQEKHWANKATQNAHYIASLDKAIVQKDSELVRHFSEECYKQELYYTAFTGFEFLKDRPGMFKAALGEYNSDATKVLFHQMLTAYLGNNTIDKIETNVNQWIKEKNCKAQLLRGEIIPQINMAYNLAREYDIGVAIANGGLLPGFFFEQSGLPVEVAEFHRRSRSDKVTWKTNVNQDTFKGKKVLVMEKDVVTGKTATRVLNEIMKHNPYQVDIALALNPISSQFGIGCFEQNIPAEYKNKYFPNSFAYMWFDKAVTELEKNLADK
jgi:hypoxanthine phosphoribosyltransferase